MNDCIFCKIVNKQAEATFVYEDEYMVAFKDINPKAPVHILVVSRKHIASLNEATEEDALLLGTLMLKAAAIAKEHGIAETGYKIVNNVGKHGGQIIQHLHLHIVGGQPVKVVV